MVALYPLMKYGIPLLIGGLAGAYGRRRSSGVVVHGLLALAAFAAASCLLYVYLYLQGLAAGGARVTVVALADAARGLFSPAGVLYVVVSIVFVLPLTIAGYVAGALAAGRAPEPRPPA